MEGPIHSEGLIYRGKFAFQIDWASLIVGRKFTVFALFYFVYEGNFQVQARRGGGGGLYLEKLIFGILWYSNNSIRPNELVLSFKKTKYPSECRYCVCKHTLKFRKYVKIFQIIKTLFVMYHEHLKVTTKSIFSLVCPFQEPVMLSTTH